jgi:hypothetical protein
MPQPLLFGNENEKTPVVLSYGMGVDSTALLLRWIRDGRSRDFSLEELVVLSAHTGDEFPDTQRLVETHLLPLLREFRIRYVQVARAGSSQTDGITVLDDSREPTRLFIEGDYKLSQELQANGTVPQVASSQRRCTHKSKGYPLTKWTDDEFGEREVIKAIGYNADEVFRAERSEGYATDTRPITYPLVEWGWGRKHCEDYVKRIVGETWRKSLCFACPFASGKPDILHRYRQFPEAGADALFLEHVAMAMNELMTLYSRKSLRSVLEKDQNGEALRIFQAKLNEVPWSIYRVRRILWAKGKGDRKTERLSEGTRNKIVTELLKQGAQVEDDQVRLVIRRRGEEYPTIEESLVAAPAVVEEKSRPKFDEHWERLTGGGEGLF